MQSALTFKYNFTTLFATRCFPLFSRGPHRIVKNMPFTSHLRVSHYLSFEYAIQNSVTHRDNCLNKAFGFYFTLIDILVC